MTRWKYSRKKMAHIVDGYDNLNDFAEDLLAKAPTRQGKKVKEIETDDLVHGGLRTDIFLATKINEVIGIVNRSLKNK